MKANLSNVNKCFLCLILSVLHFHANATPKDEIIISVTNPIALSRMETIEVPLSNKVRLLASDMAQLCVRKMKSDEVLLSQLVDEDGDGTDDKIIFQATFSPKEKLKFVLFASDDDKKKVPPHTTFARLVPERIDDFAWENDLVAFRTYGPEAQRLVDEGLKGGTLSSGIDCWLKRVGYPVINKWYQKFVDGGTYHKDDGEGYDPYHVGNSRGCGGIGVRQNDSLFVSKNFTDYKIVSNGPIRTVFELQYAPWNANGIVINEKKRITIDLGSQMYHAEVNLSGDLEITNCTVGVTLHDSKGQVTLDSVKGWMSYWEKIDDAYIGTGVVMKPSSINKMIDYRTKVKDQSQLLLITTLEKGEVDYYAGYGWEKAGEFKSIDEWNAYLKEISERVAHPVILKVK